jgi:hypothetical protein
MCIAADGIFLKPMAVIPCLTVKQEVYEIGYTPNRVMLEYQEDDFISTQLFEKWVNEIFLPHVDDM